MAAREPRCDEYRDLLELWVAWWNGPGRERFNGVVVPPLTRTAEALACSLCAGVMMDETCERCAACGRRLSRAARNPEGTP